MTDAEQARFAGYVLGCTNPEQLAAWYQKAFKGDTGEILGRPMVVVGGARVVFDPRDDITGKPSEPGRFIINVLVPDIDATAAHLDELGVTWLRAVERVEDFGGIGTFEDPEGNYVQLLAPVGS
jgi:predicted enzyme related to lactoylglutathione lyase